MKKLLATMVMGLMWSGSAFTEVVSKNPKYLKRGFGYDEVHIANYQKKELHKHNYTIIKDPTGTSPFKLIENFSPRKGDCGTAGHFYKANRVKIGSGTTDCNSNRLRLEVAIKHFRTGKKDKNVWVSYYIYIPDTKENFNDKFLQPYITQFYGSNKEGGGQNRGGYGPQFSASIYNGKLTMDGVTLVDKENLKGKWHLIEFNILYSKTNGHVKAYINGELKVDRTGFETSKHSHAQIKYGSYSHPEYGGASYPAGYQFPSHTIYFAGFSISRDRNKLLTSKKL